MSYIEKYDVSLFKGFKENEESLVKNQKIFYSESLISAYLS